MKNKILQAALLVIFSVGNSRADSVLTLRQAIDLAIQNNLSNKLAQADSELARGKAIQDAAKLLPQIMGSVSETRNFKVNLAAEGFASFPVAGFNPIIGPFNTFDARLSVVEHLLNVNYIYKSKASKAGHRMAILQEQLAREQVATATALTYLEAQRAQRAVAAAQADLTLSQKLFTLAKDQHSAGISTGIDVARAETEQAQGNLRLIRTQVAMHQANLRLKRVIGLPLDQAMVLADLPQAALTELPVEDKAIGLATHDRLELQIAKESYEQEQDLVRAAKAENLPFITVMGDYGHSGTAIDDTARTGSIGGRLDVPIFAGGSAHGKVVEETANLKEAGARRADIGAQVEEDVRLSLQTLSAEMEETKTANQALQLAQKELKMAQDRFSAGVGDNIQVLNAQTVLARALDDQVDAFARYDTARVNLATAMGHAQEFQ